MTDEVKINKTLLQLVKDDLTAMDIEAFVFYARPDLILGSGYGNAISTRGGVSIKQELEKLSPAEPLSAVITGAGLLKAKHIIHAVGPAFQEADINSKLIKTIENTLKCADENKIKHLAFPLMGAGFYGIEINTCIKIMFETIEKYIEKSTNLEKIVFCANDVREYQFFSKHFEELKKEIII